MKSLLHAVSTCHVGTVSITTSRTVHSRGTYGLVRGKGLHRDTINHRVVTVLVKFVPMIRFERNIVESTCCGDNIRTSRTAFEFRLTSRVTKDIFHDFHLVTRTTQVTTKILVERHGSYEITLSIVETTALRMRTTVLCICGVYALDQLVVSTRLMQSHDVRTCVVQVCVCWCSSVDLPAM